MYRVPQKQTWRWTVLNCGRSCFHQVSYPNHLSFSSNWNILHLSWRFDLLHILLYYFCDSIILSCQFTLSKEKKLRRNVAFSTTAICIFCFEHLHLSANYCSFGKFDWRQKYGLSQIFCFLSVSHMLAFWGTLLILTIKIS